MTVINEIIIKGAREHNLQNVDLILPRNELIVFTGMSGSGKSSLAMDTIYAEGQRRYVESLSAYARQFLNIMDKPELDSISGLSPAISIEQKRSSRNPRSTVGTITEINDYLRLLFARVGTPYSPATGLAISAQQISDMVDQLLQIEEGTRFTILSPLIRDRRGTFHLELMELKKKGFLRVKIDGISVTLDDIPALNKNKRHTIHLVVDRLVAKPDYSERYAQSLRTALDHGSGTVHIEFPESEKREEITFSENFSCPVSGFSLPKIEPRLFSFNTPVGACPDCDGIGYRQGYSPELIIESPRESILDILNKLKFYSLFDFSQLKSEVEILCLTFDISMKTKIINSPKMFRDLFFYGGQINYESRKTAVPFDDNFNFIGVIPFLEFINNQFSSLRPRSYFDRFITELICEACQGKRLSPEALSVKVGGINIADLSDRSIKEALDWAKHVSSEFNKEQLQIGQPILNEIQERLQFLNNVGLDYLTLSRTAGTLSGGESQRIRLASQIGSGLTGVLYVLDEPSIGLHQRDNKRLLSTIANLRDKGNTVIVVEHDEETIRAADHIVDIGPKAGIHGGQVVAQGSVNNIIACENSITGEYLSGKKEIPLPSKRRKVNKANARIRIKGARANNLKSVDVQIPLGCMICVTGVSGSGKSSLVFESLYSSFKGNDMNLEQISGFNHINNIIHIDQRPIGKTPRSNPLTYTGTFDPVRKLFAETPMARARGYKPGRFSFNVKGGRCEACSGDGVKKISMHFLSDVFVMCESCQGKRYNRETLEVKYLDKSIADVLDMTIEEAYHFFTNVPIVRRKLETLVKAGLGYLKTGHQAPLLSGGEAQRVKLATELSRTNYLGTMLYLLDEPTTGLHFEDIKNLLQILNELVDQKNTVLVIEHNLDVIKTADWIIDMGPEGGAGGGEVIAQGSPEQVAMIPQSFTGKFLAEILQNRINKAA
ncbi:MAG: excinuclease ABC subunit UvrA [Rhodobacteraceae bacterium]|nr:excinuclease ABC subunit UvrA [Paracoccaceae bacterium]